MMATMQFRVYCTNCDKDGEYSGDCLVAVMHDRTIKMQHPEEVLPKGWRWVGARLGSGLYGEPVCETCFETLVAMGKAKR